jgi:DNA polymerase III alpha subunit
VERASAIDMPALALTDRNGLYGASLFARACEAAGIHPVFGAQLDLEGDAIVLLCRNMQGYRNLSQLITAAQRERPKGQACATLEQLAAYKEGLIALTDCLSQERIEQYRALFGRRDLYVALTYQAEAGDLQRCRQLSQLAEACGLAVVATGGTRYTLPAEGRLLDVLTCIKHRTTLRESHHLRPTNHLRFLKPPGLPHWKRAQANTFHIAEQCQVSLSFSDSRFPAFPVPSGLSAHQYLTQLCLERLPREAMRSKLLEELALIAKLDLSGYFLVVWDLMEFAKRKGIEVCERFQTNFGHACDERRRDLKHLAHLADCALGAKSGKSAHHSDVVLTIPLVDILDHIFAVGAATTTRRRKVEVDIGDRRHLLVDEAPQKQIVGQWIDRCDAQYIGH